MRQINETHTARSKNRHAPNENLIETRPSATHRYIDVFLLRRGDKRPGGSISLMTLTAVSGHLAASIMKSIADDRD